MENISIFDEICRIIFNHILFSVLVSPPYICFDGNSHQIYIF